MKKFIKICFPLVAVLMLTTTCGNEDKITIVPVTNIDLLSKLTLAPDASYFLTASISPENATDRSITWRSDKENVVTVDHRGYLTALTEGVATITAKTNDGGFEKTCVVTVLKGYWGLLNLIKNPGFENPSGTTTNDTQFSDGWKPILGNNAWWEDYYGPSPNFGTGGGAANSPNRWRDDQSDWNTATDGYKDVKGVISGRYVARIPNNQRAGLYQDINVVPGKVYKFGADVAIVKSNNNQAMLGEKLRILGKNADGKWTRDIASVDFPLTGVTVNGAVSYVFIPNLNKEFTMPDGVTKVRFQISQWTNDPAGTRSPTILFDQCYFYEVMEDDEEE